MVLYVAERTGHQPSFEGVFRGCEEACFEGGGAGGSPP